MGVRGLTSWLRHAFPHAFVPLAPDPAFTHLYIDLNPVLHHYARRSHTEADLVSRTLDSLHAAVRLHRPQRLFLAVDGAAPLAKMPEQRRRRISSSPSVQREHCFNTQNFTPGCSFMARLEERLLGFLQRLPNIEEIVVSGASTAGEGEAKIFWDIQGAEDTAGSTCAVMTCDSDAFLQGMPRAHPFRSTVGQAPGDAHRPHQWLWRSRPRRGLFHPPL